MTAEELIRFESLWPKHNGTKEEAIRNTLGESPARYYQMLNRAACTLEGMRTDPITARLVRERAHRAA